MIHTVRTTIVSAVIIAVICAVSSGIFAVCTVSGGDGVDVPIIMYHSIVDNAKRRGTYVITPADLESDLRWLSENGYSAVLMEDIISFSNGKSNLPEKPVVLTFDDGCLNNLTYAFPLMEKYNMKFVVSVVGAYTDTYTKNPDPNPNYAYLTWDDVRYLSESGICEIQNHTYNLHSNSGGRLGCKKLKGETAEHYERLLLDDIGGMQSKIEECTGKRAAVFTYPYGGVSNASLDIIKKLGFSASLSCSEGINTLHGNPEELFLLKRCIRSDKRSVSDILSRK